MIFDLLGQALGDLRAEFDGRHHVGGACDQLHVVGDEDDAGTLLLDLTDQRFQPGRLLGPHARGGFVQQQQLGAGGQGAGDLQQVLVGPGQVPGPASGRALQAHEGQLLHRPLPHRPLLPGRPEGRMQEGVRRFGLGLGKIAAHHVIQYAHAPHDLGDLEGAADAQAGDLVGGQAGDVPAAEKDLSVGGREHAADDVECGGLAGAVGADEAMDGPLRYGQVQFLDGMHAAKALVDFTQFQDIQGVPSCLSRIWLQYIGAL